MAALLESGTAEALTSAVALLRKSEDVGAATPETMAPENFLLAAEGSLEAHASSTSGSDAMLKQARECVEHFMRSRPAKTQFLSRAYFALGRVQAAEAAQAQAKGQALATALLDAANVVQEGIAIAATMGPTHRFLVYNGSVHVYRITRPLLSYEGDTAEKLAALLETTLKVLKEAEEPDADWRLQLSMQLARCYERCGKKKEAAALLLACATGEKGEQSLADKCDAALQEQLLQQQAHVLLDDAAALKKLRDEAATGPTATPRRRALILTQLLVDGGPPGDPKGGGFDMQAEVEGAMGALDPALGEALAIEGDVAARRKVVQQAPLGGTPHDDVLINLATQAAAHGLLELASLCATRCTSSAKLACRVRSSYIQAMVMVGELDASGEYPAQGEVYTRRMVSTRIEALGILEEAVNSARRVGEPALVQDGCVIIWNVSLPLLQPSLIGYAERTLYLAASALEAIASPLSQLRASLHLELARLDATRDFMQKAAQHVNKALLLDVPADAGIGAEVNPILRPLRTLGTRLALKTDVYRVAENPEEKVVLLLEQARTDRRIPLKKQILEQTLEELQMSEPDPEPKLTPEEEAAAAAEDAARKEKLTPEEIEKEVAEEKKKLDKKRERAALWSELMRAGWALRLTAMARAAALAVLLPTWNIATDAELARDQADARYVLGETYISELNERAEAAAEAEAKAKEALASGTASMRNLPQIAPPGQAEAEAAARDLLRGQALENMCAGVAIGLELQDDLIVQNGCIYVLNYNRSLLRAGDYAPLVPSLKACVDALQKCDQEAMKKDVQQLRIVAATATALALALEQTASTRAPDGSVTHDAKDPDQAAALKDAVDASKWACELCTGYPSIKRQLTACWARLQAYAGTKEPFVGTEPEAGALALLELLACGLVDTGAAGAGALGKAKELLISDGSPRAEPELWVRVAQQAMALGDLASVVKACDAALKPLHSRTQAAAPAPAPAPAPSPAPAAKSGKDKNDLSTILREEWRWYAMAETVHSEAIGKLLKEGQQAALQQQLHANALIHLASAMKYANNAAEGSLLLSAAQRFWVHVKPFLSASPPDHRLRGPVGTALAELERLDASLQPQVIQLRVRLYEAQLAVLAHAQAWAEGLSLLNAAFSSLPEASMQPLWEEKVNFMCKGGGKGLAGEMYKLKDFEPAVQARVWAVLGQAAPTTGEQLNAMLKAVDTLSSEPLLKVQYLIALAQWLYTHDFPPRDSEDQLMAAVDILMDHEDLPDDGDEDDTGDGASSIGSASMSQSTRTAMTKSGAGSVASSRAGRSSVGGSSRGAPAEATLTVTQYEQLARIYLMRSMMASSLAARLECAFVATHYLARLWDVAISTCNAAELAKPDRDPSAPPPFWLPREVNEWAGWAVSPELEEAMAAINSERVISPASLPDAQLTVAYLKYLIDLLLHAGLHLHALMPLMLLKLMAKRILDSPALERATAMYLAHTLHELGLTEKAASARAALGELRPSPEVMRKNAVTLRQLRQADDAVTTSMPTADDPPSDEALGLLSAPASRRKSCARPVEAEWVELAALLIAEGEWAAAREWLLEAAPLLAARGELEHESRCRRLLAKLHALHGDPKAAVSAQLSALHMTALEAEPWAEAVLDLAQYRADAGDEKQRIATLEAGVELAAASATEHASGAVDARAAQARLLQALGLAYGETAATLAESGSGASDEAAAAARALDASVQIYLDLGDQRHAAIVLRNRAALHNSAPVSSSESHDYVLEAEASHLDKLGELLHSAHSCAERSLFLAAPRTISTQLSLPIARELSAIKVDLAALYLRHATLNAKVAAANPTPGPSFPTVEGGDDTIILNYVAPTVVVPPPVHMEPEGRAQLHAASAVALAGSGAARARALVASGEVLYARAHAAGWGKAPGRWEMPTPPAAPADEGEEGGEEGAAEAAPADALGEEGAGASAALNTQADGEPQAGVADATAAEAVLKEAMALALLENDLATAERAALLLARAYGLVQPEACARYLALFQACAAHRHWRAEWISACGPSERVALLARVTQWLPARWNAPGALPALQAAESALADEAAGCASWRALSVPSDPLEEMWPVLTSSMRVLTLAIDDSDMYSTCIAAVPGELPPGGLPKGAEPPPPQQVVKVSRLEGVAPAVLRLIGEMSNMLSTQSKAALQRSKDDLFAVEVKGSAAAQSAAAREAAAREAFTSGKVPNTTVSSAIVPASARPESETKLRAVVEAMDQLLLPLLEPLLPLLGDDETAGGGDKLQVVIVAGTALAVLPLELLQPLRRAHVAATSRDISAPILGRRLARTASEPCVGKKASFAAAVDPRSEVSLPKTADERPDSAKAAAATKKGKGAPKKGKGEPTEAEPKTKSVCDAFRKDVLEGTSVAFGKEWAEKAVLLGSDHVPSSVEWQRTMLGSSAFVYAGPGAFHEQLAPSHVAPLQLESVTACLLFDRAASDAASRRLAKEANAKRPGRIALETSHATAALLSLSGVRTVLTNQWAVGAQSNHDMLVSMLGKLGSGASLGDALGACARSAMAYTPEPEQAPAAAEDVSDPTAEAPAEEAAAPAPAAADEPEALWTILANPVIYGLPTFTVG